MEHRRSLARAQCAQILQQRGPAWSDSRFRAALTGFALLVASSAAHGQLRAEVRLLTQNAYGVADCFCDLRADQLGANIANSNPAFDVVGIQEHYATPVANCDSHHLYDAITASGRYPNGDYYRRQRPVRNNGLDGATDIFSRFPICDYDEWLWDHQQTLDAAYGGFLARVPIPGSSVTLDVYIVHLHAGVDGCDQDCRRDELALLTDKIAENSGRSGNPVFVMGDFNIGGPPSCGGNCGYDDIRTSLSNAKDMWIDAHPCGDPPCNQCDVAPFNPPCQPFCGAGCPSSTLGHTNDLTVNPLADGEDRIDYIFAITEPPLATSAYTVSASAAADVKLVQWDFTLPSHQCAADSYFFCGEEDCQPEGSMIFVSDHFGVEATVEIRGIPTVRVDPALTGPECGPYRTIPAAIDHVPDGGRVQVWSGSYPGALTIAKPLRVEAVNGMVAIGR
jgi:endonuclease/exonuclease/phosphatase family metal-dependent hydrolase